MTRYIELQHLPIRLTARGEWLHGESPLHPRVAALFAKSIVPDTEGRYRIVLGKDTETVEVEDVAFFVVAMRLDEDQSGSIRSVSIRLSDDREELLDPSTLMISEENVLYALIERHGVSVPCRFPPSLYHRLCLRVEEAPTGVFVLPVGGSRWPIRPRPKAKHSST